MPTSSSFRRKKRTERNPDAKALLISVDYSSIKAFARCAGPQGPYTTEIHSARGDRLKCRQVFRDGSSFLGLVNGRHAWTVDRVKLPSRITATDRSGEFALDFHRITLNDVAGRLFEVPPAIASVAELMRLQKVGLHQRDSLDDAAVNPGLLPSVSLTPHLRRKIGRPEFREFKHQLANAPHGTNKLKLEL
jgi:hypothetical protein